MSDQKSPTPTQIKSARESLGLTQTEAADIIHCGRRAYMEWEAGNREMHPALWELWCLKTEYEAVA